MRTSVFAIFPIAVLSLLACNETPVPLIDQLKGEKQPQEVIEEENHYPNVELNQETLATARRMVGTAVTKAKELEQSILSGDKTLPLSPSDKDVDELWYSLYDAIGYLGGLLHYVEENAVYFSVNTNRYQKDLLYCKALCYGELLYFWGQVPLWEQGSFLEIPNSSAREVCDFICHLADKGIQLEVMYGSQGFLNVSENDIAVIAGQALWLRAAVLGDVDIVYMSLEHFLRIIDSGESDFTSGAIGVFGTRGPSAAYSYASILLYTAYDYKMQMYDETATDYYNMVMSWIGRELVSNAEVEDIVALMKEVNPRSFAMENSLLGNSSVQWLPIPTSYLSKNSNCLQNVGY